MKVKSEISFLTKSQAASCVGSNSIVCAVCKLFRETN